MIYYTQLKKKELFPSATIIKQKFSEIDSKSKRTENFNKV